MITLKEAYEDHIESGKFMNIIEKNYGDYPTFILSDGIEISIDFSHSSMGFGKNGVEFYWWEVPNTKKIFEMEIHLKMNYNIFGLVLNSDEIEQTIDEIKIKFWLLKDNYVYIYHEKSQTLIETSDFIKSLKNPLKFINL